MVHLRLSDIDPRDLVAITKTLVGALAVPVIVNDRADVALAAGAAGVHLGSEDIPPFALRTVMPDGFLIGASIGSDAELPRARGADYVTIGPVFASTAMPGAGGAIGLPEFARLARIAGVPAVAVGGISEKNAGEVFSAGAAGVAVIRSVFAAPDPEIAARALWSATGS
jgi:thiamine-phosphate pyrophosphorylase